ncbi:oxidoreductase [Roseateles sp. P5_E11]
MKVWFITGGSRGLGAAIASSALAVGDAVVATARDAQAVEERLGRQRQLLALQLDVTREDEARDAVTRAIDAFGRVDVLVNNAGRGLLGAVEEVTACEAEDVFRTNVFGLLNVTRAVLPHMRQRRSGWVINVSSIGGIAASAGWGVYCATKFAVEGISESMALELEPLGIHSTAIEPGYFRTDFLSSRSLVRSGGRIDDYEATVGRTRAFVDAAHGQQPGDPERLAEALVALSTHRQPPRHMPFGSDTLRRIVQARTLREQETAAWRHLTTSTEFPPDQPTARR